MQPENIRDKLSAWPLPILFALLWHVDMIMLTDEIQGKTGG